MPIFLLRYNFYPIFFTVHNFFYLLYLHTTIIPAMIIMDWSSETVSEPPQIFSSIRVVIVIGSLHSNKNLIKTVQENYMDFKYYILYNMGR